MSRQEVELALTVAISEYANTRMKHLQHEMDEPEAFLDALTLTLEFCAGTVMSRFLVTVRDGRPNDRRFDIADIQKVFCDMIAHAEHAVCMYLPSHIASVDAVVATRKRGAHGR
jgi:hypothetical protein